MNIFLSVLLFVAGLVLVIYFAEKLVEGAVGTSLGFGISAFLVSVIFIGFDPENLAVGAVGAFEGVAGIALGSVIGACMVAIAFAFGITALLVPLRFEEAPKQTLAVPILAVLLLGGLGLDRQLSRVDGAILLFGFVLSIGYLLWLSRRGLDIEATGEVAETLEEAAERYRCSDLTADADQTHTSLGRRRSHPLVRCLCGGRLPDLTFEEVLLNSKVPCDCQIGLVA